METQFVPVEYALASIQVFISSLVMCGPVLVCPSDPTLKFTILEQFR